MGAFWRHASERRGAARLSAAKKLRRHVDSAGALQRCSSSHAHANERPQRRLAWPTARLGPLGVVFRIVQGCGGAGAQRCEHRELPRHADSADRGAEGSRSSSTAARGGAAQSASARRAVDTDRPRRSLWSARGDRYVSRRCGAEESLRRQFAAARAGEHPRHVRAPRPELLRQRGQRDQLRPGRWRQQQPRSPGGIGAPGRDAGACGNTQRISSRGRLSDRL